MTADEEDDEVTAPEPAPAPDTGRSTPPRRVTWSSPELAWPLSIAAGFVGTYLGVKSGFPGAAALIAAAAFSPIFVRLQARRRVGVAFLSSGAWLVGIVAALVGATVEGDGLAVLEVVPLSSAFATVEWSRGDVAGLGAHAGSVVRNLAVFLLVIGLARPYAGVLALLVAAYVADLLGAGAAQFAEGMIAESWSPSYSALVGSPPHLVLGLLGALAAASVVASPGRLLPLSYVEGERRHLLFGGLIVGMLALLLQPWIAPLWQQGLG